MDENVAIVVSTPAAPVQVPVDASDPIVAILGWVLAGVLRRYLGKRASEYRSFIPIAAILIAVALRAGYAVLVGESFDTATLLRAIAAGAVAVAGHSQFREAIKLSEDRKIAKKPIKKAPPPVSTVPPSV